MAKRAGQITGLLTAGVLALVLMGGLVPLFWHGTTATLLPADWAALRFTVLQAAASAALCCALAIPLARALHRRRFWGRGALIRLISAPFILPSVAAILGLLAIFGRSGPINSALAALGAPPLPIFGFGGVVLAHVFLNLPLACRMLLQGWAAIPAERFRLAQDIGMGPAAQFRLLEWPMLRAGLPSIFAAVFLICLTSFAVALILGGGPRATTIELGLYQSLRFDFDLGRAALLALVQTALCLGAIALLALIWRPAAFGVGLDREVPPSAQGSVSVWIDGLIITLAALFLVLPLLAVMIRGLSGLGEMPDSFAPAALRSIGIAVLAAALATAGALALAWARANGAGLWAEFAAMLPLGTSSLALGTGLFLSLRPWVDPLMITLPMAVILNAALTLPFLYRMLLPACTDLMRGYGRLGHEVQMSPLALLRVVMLPRLSRDLGFCMGLGAAMSMGDFGVVALFAAPQDVTLPVLIGRLMGAYQMELAAAMTLWLVAISLLLFWIFESAGSRYAKG
jgi:thiamine transport system permease protein